MTRESALQNIRATRQTLLENSLAGKGGDLLHKVKPADVFDTYRELGGVFKDPIRDGLRVILEDKDNLPIRLERAQTFKEKLALLKTPEGKYSQHFQDFETAVSGWMDGADIESLCKDYGVETPYLATLILLDQNAGGCQTNMFRVSDGTVVMAHTEEDANVTELMSIFPIVSTKINGKESTTVCYDKRMPGCATFQASEGFSVACDYLWLDPAREPGEGAFINAFSWIIGRMGKDITPEDILEIAKLMGPFVDGYAINIVKDNGNGGVDGYRVTVAYDKCVIEELGAEPGSFLTQATIIDPKYAETRPDVFELSKPDLPKYQKYKDRIRRMDFLAGYFGKRVDLSSLKDISDAEIHNFLHNLMSLGVTIDGEWSFANSTVGASCSTVVRSRSQSSAVINLGPAIRDQKDLRRLIYF